VTESDLFKMRAFHVLMLFVALLEFGVAALGLPLFWVVGGLFVAAVVVDARQRGFWRPHER
jgi:hypothetical protein